MILNSDNSEPDSPLPESLVDRLIREAMEAGDFDDLPGAGEPLSDLAIHHDPNWWVRKLMTREGITADELRQARRISD